MTLKYVRRFIDPRDQYRRWIDPRLDTLRLDQVLVYLDRKGWKELPPDRPGYRAFQEPGEETLAGRPLCQFVPDTEEVDLPLRMFELLTGIAEAEDRPAAQVIDDILATSKSQGANGASPAQATPSQTHVS